MTLTMKEQIQILSEKLKETETDKAMLVDIINDLRADVKTLQKNAEIKKFETSVTAEANSDRENRLVNMLIDEKEKNYMLQLEIGKAKVEK